MAIAHRLTSALGFDPNDLNGPFGVTLNVGQPPVNYGDIVHGAPGAEFIYLRLIVTSTVTLNQGDVVVWDNSYTATLSATGSGAHPFGAGVGTVYFNGRIGTTDAEPWSNTFAPGTYGILAQVRGVGLANIASVNAQSKPANTTAVAGQLDQPATALSGSMAVIGLYSAPTSVTFTATTTSGSSTLTAVSSGKSLTRGLHVSGTGIPTGSYIVSITGNIVTISAAATATGSSVTITAITNRAYGNTTNGSTVVTGVPSLPGVYPNQTITGTGIPASTTILSIVGQAGNYTITLSQAATATGTNIALSTTGYYETFLNFPYISGQN